MTLIPLIATIHPYSNLNYPGLGFADASRNAMPGDSVTIWHNAFWYQQMPYAHGIHVQWIKMHRREEGAPK